MVSEIEKTYGELILETLEIVTRMAGSRLPLAAIDYAKSKLGDKINALEYSRFAVNLELGDAAKKDQTQAAKEVYFKILEYIRDIIGNSANDYANGAIRKLAARGRQDLPTLI